MQKPLAWILVDLMCCVFAVIVYVCVEVQTKHDIIKLKFKNKTKTNKKQKTINKTNKKETKTNFGPSALRLLAGRRAVQREGFGSVTGCGRAGFLSRGH